MLNFRLTLRSSQKEALKTRLNTARTLGNMRLVNRILSILAIAEGTCQTQVANILRVSEESIRLWLCAFLLHGVRGLGTKQSHGRPQKLTKTQKKELAEILDRGPAEAGFLSNCWRSPMIQHLIYEKFGIE